MLSSIRQTMIEALVRIVTPSGMRLEYINDWISKDEKVVLNSQNGFSMCTTDNVQVRVGGWGADTFKVERATAASMICPVAVSNVQYDASDEDDAEETPTTGIRKRKRAPSDAVVVIENAASMMELLTIVPERKRRKCMNSCLFRRSLHPSQPNSHAFNFSCQTLEQTMCGLYHSTWLAGRLSTHIASEHLA